MQSHDMYFMPPSLYALSPGSGGFSCRKRDAIKTSRQKGVGAFVLFWARLHYILFIFSINAALASIFATASFMKLPS